MLARPGVREAMILSTCNRVEILTTQETAADLVDFLKQYFGDRSPVAAAARLRVSRAGGGAASLPRRRQPGFDGGGRAADPGPGKGAVTRWRARSGAVRGQLEKLLQCAFAAAKKVRTETEIGSSSVSIASVAVDLARKIFGSLEGKTVFLVGAGKMSELAARHLMQQGAGAILVANRTHERALRMAESFHGKAIRFEDLYSAADQADIIITSTGAPHAIFRREHGQRFCRGGATGRCSLSTLPCRAMSIRG